MKTSAKLRRVEFSYAVLSENYDRILSALQVADGVNMTYIDETRGVIGIGLESLSKVESLRARLGVLGVPKGMVGFEQSQLGVPETTLNQKYRPLIGGLQIQHHSITNTCSLGFNVFRRGPDNYSPDPSLGRYFFTASHCSGTWGVFSGAFMYQHVTGAGNRIGVEFEVAPKLTYPACPSPAQSPCQVADVMVGRSDDSVLVSYMRVANVDASKNIIGTFNLQGATTYGGLDGETITMVGATSGKRTSTIMKTCVNRTFPDDITGGTMTILCLQETNYVSGSGDSGAPVFIPYIAGNWNTPRVVGIHMGSTDNEQGQPRKYFSPITQIEYALPTLYYWF